MYGQFPDFTLGGTDGATLGRWFGADPDMLETQVFKKELSKFAMSDLGFMG